MADVMGVIVNMFEVGWWWDFKKHLETGGG